jgi:hypothetical protein
MDKELLALAIHFFKELPSRSFVGSVGCCQSIVIPSSDKCHASQLLKIEITFVSHNSFWFFRLTN